MHPASLGCSRPHESSIGERHHIRCLTPHLLVRLNEANLGCPMSLPVQLRDLLAPTARGGAAKTLDHASIKHDASGRGAGPPCLTALAAPEIHLKRTGCHRNKSARSNVLQCLLRASAVAHCTRRLTPPAAADSHRRSRFDGVPLQAAAPRWRARRVSSSPARPTQRRVTRRAEAARACEVDSDSAP